VLLGFAAAELEPVDDDQIHLDLQATERNVSALSGCLDEGASTA
jgi:hypothetical protein